MHFPALAVALVAALPLAAPAFAQATGTTLPDPVFDTPPDLSFGADMPATAGTGSIMSSQGRPIGGSVDWTGFYIGGQFGAGFTESNRSSNDESIMGGVTLGYDHDFGRWVLGGALDYDFADAEVAPGADLEEVFRLKIRGGPKIGRGLLYGAAGWAVADTSSLGDDDGWFIGGGYEYMVNDRFSVGGEVLYHEFDSFNGTGNDIEFTSVQVRATYRF
ncbi:outer membrane immunogenic protein [Roseovarius sp. MBR-78]|uniref:outer membrane protein n=1 Tax=Roseovarius sp. MBR-78 TaxID=3156460 RepID=UPI00339A3BA8